MSSKGQTQNLTSEIAADLALHGVEGVQVDIDATGIAYLSGTVKELGDDAAAVTVVLSHGVTQVQDGLETPHHVVPDLQRSGAIGPRSHHTAQAMTPEQQLLGSAHLEGRIFDGSSSETHLESGTPLGKTRGV